MASPLRRSAQPEDRLELDEQVTTQQIVWVALAVLFGFLLRHFHLDHQSLWVDEILTWLNAEIGSELSWGDVVGNDHGPLLQVVLHLVGDWFGESEYVLRFPLMVASGLTTLAVALLARSLLGSSAMVPAAWLASLSPFLIWYGQESRNYAFAILFATLAAWAVIEWKRRGGVPWGLAFVGFTWLGFLSNLNVVLVAPVFLLYLALPHSRRPSMWRPAILAVGALFVLELPWILDHFERLAVERLIPGRAELPGEAPLRGPTTFTLMGYPFAIYTFSVGYTLGPTIRALHGSDPMGVALSHLPVIATTAIAFGVLGFAGLWGLRKRPATLLFLIGLLAVPALLVTYMAVQNFKVFNPRYLSSGLSGYYLILVAGWLTVSPRARVYLAAVILGLFAFSLSNLYFIPDYGKENYRLASQWLSQNIRNGDQLIASGNYGPLEYYWRGRTPQYEIFWIGYARNPERLRAEFAAARDSSRTCWVVVSRPFLDDPSGSFQRFLREEIRAREVDFVGVHVYQIPSVANPTRSN